MLLNELKNKSILILGFGREGKDTFLFLRRLFPQKTLAIADLRKDIGVTDKKTKLYLGENYLKALKKYEVIIKSPGVPPKVIAPFLTKKQEIISQTGIFFENFPGTIIGVTGTKGKSTTSFLIWSLLKESGVKAHLVGNIGEPVLSYLFKAGRKDVFVYELSSHQLFYLKKSPQIAVLLNIFPEHLDYYRDLKEYIRAKANITRFQKKDDFFIFNSGDKLVQEIARKTIAKKVPIKGRYLSLDKEAAKAVARILKLATKRVNKALREFKGLPHRLEEVGSFRGITFYNDSLATIPQATIEALKVLGGKVETLILGGFDRKIEFRELAREILKSKVKTLIFFPTTGEKIWKEIERQNKKRLKPFFVNGAKKTSFSSSPSPGKNGAQYMRDAVKIAFSQTKRGKVCLLSPAAASFNLFRDYRERGNLFKKYVKHFSSSKR